MTFSRAALAFGLMAVLTTSPASAERWALATDDHWTWVDFDSLSQQGTFVAYLIAHGATDGVLANAAGHYRPRRAGVDCATGQMFNPGPDGASWLPSMNGKVIDWSKDPDDPANQRMEPMYLYDYEGGLYRSLCRR